ncbi:MFS transporter [Micropruina sp.]|uniref:MFS transporter n=1 Tax=Micropruina sp. TaxID=2737536 RepID=UPI00261DF154|nr:MFS transporter [Micropruina sp.]
MRAVPRWGDQLKQAFAEPNLARLLLIWGIWVAADWTVVIATSVLGYQLGGPAGIGLVGAARALPGALLSGFVALATDRISRPRVLAGSQVLLGLVSMTMVWLAMTRAPLAVLVVVIGVNSVLVAVVRTTVLATVPQVVRTPAELIAANSAMSTVGGLGTVIGPMVCGVLLSVAGVPAALAFPAAVLVAGAVAARSVKTAFQPPRHGDVGGWRRALEPMLGFPELVRPRVRVVTGLNLLQLIMRGLLNVFVVVLAITVLGSDGQAGTLFAAMGVGSAVAALVVLGTAPQRGIRWFAIGIALWGVPVVAIGLWPNAVLAWVALAVLGAGSALVDIFGNSQLSRLFRDQVAGRAWGAFSSMLAGGIAIGAMVAPTLIEQLGLPGAMMASGAVLALVPLAVWPWLRRLQEPVDAEALAVLGRVELLAPLPALVLERLASASRKVTLADGEFAVREGEVGDEFYVVVSGAVSVQRQGREVRTMGPGDGFGEIALLRAVPRTATVRSVGASTLRSIDRGSFMAAVTGHIGADRTAHGTAEQWLRDDAARDRIDPRGGPGTEH